MKNRESRMRRIRRLPRSVRLSAMVLVVLSGCRSASPGLIVEHRPGDGAKAAPVPYAATYVLRSIDETGTEVTVLQRADIQDEFQIGFVRQIDGTLAAYAGGRKFPLAEGHYEWHIAPESLKTRAEVADAAVGKVLVPVGQALGYIGEIVMNCAFGMLSSFARSGGHN